MLILLMLTLLRTDKKILGLFVILFFFLLWRRHGRHGEFSGRKLTGKIL